MKSLQKFLLLLLTAFSAISCYQVERNCSEFMTGTFEYEAMVGTELLKTTFIRSDSIEIEHFKGHTDTSSIRWINDCEYIVKNLNPKSRSEEKAIHMKIISTDGDEYLFEYNVVGNSKKQRGTVKKIN
jgi:hypothetical protein